MIVYIDKSAVSPSDEPHEGERVQCELVAVDELGAKLVGSGWEVGGYNGPVYDENGTQYEKEELIKLLLFEEAEALYKKMDRAGVLDEFKESNDVSSIVFVVLAETGAVDDVTASEHAAVFSEWAVGIQYLPGQIRRWKEKLYRCVQAHTSQADWTPDVVPALWTAISDPAEEWPEWSQPIGAHDAYELGAKVSCDGKHWISTVNANIWRPGVYGWDEGN